MGTIGRKTDPPANTRSDDSLNVTLPTPLPVPRRIEHEATDRMASPESRLPSHQWSPRSGLGCSHETTGGLVPEPTRLAHMVDQFHIGGQPPSVTLDHSEIEHGKKKEMALPEPRPLFHPENPPRNNFGYAQEGMTGPDGSVLEPVLSSRNVPEVVQFPTRITDTPFPLSAPTVSQNAYWSPFRSAPLQRAIPPHEAPPIRFLCDKCGLTFSRQYDRNRHYESAHSENPPVHVCEGCGKQFSRADAKKRHQDGKCLNGIPLGL